MLAAVTAALCTVCWLRDVFFIIESPASTWLAETCPLKQFLGWLLGSSKRQVLVYLGSYGGKSLRSTWLWGTWAPAKKLGIKKVNKKLEKGPCLTSRYPRAFAKAILINTTLTNSEPQPASPL